MSSVDVGEIRPCTLSKIEMSRREQISPEGQQKFRYDDKKLSVVIYDYDEMKILSDYIGLDIRPYLESYLMTNNNVPVIMNCDHRLSLAPTVKNGMLSGMLSMMGGPTWEQQEARALPLEVFLNPGDYPEYMV